MVVVAGAEGLLHLAVVVVVIVVAVFFAIALHATYKRLSTAR